MRLERIKITILLICCFLCAIIITFIMEKESNVIVKNHPTDMENKQELIENIEQKQQKQHNTKAVLGTDFNNIQDLEALLGDMIDGDIGDTLDMIWSGWEITCDFSDCNEVAEIVDRFPVESNTTLSEQQLEQLYSYTTTFIYNHGTNDYNSLIDFFRKSGETIGQSYYEGMRKMEIARGIPEEDITNDRWRLLSERVSYIRKEHDRKSFWKGLVLEGSNIKVFEARTSDLPIGQELVELRGGVTYYSHRFSPPISFEQVLGENGKVVIADVMVFIAHDDSIGGVVWPYIIRYWFDPVNNSWRIQKVALLRNRHTAYPIYMML